MGSEAGRNLKRLEVEDSSVTMSSDTDISLSSYDEDQGSKLIRKAREAPFVPIGKFDFDDLISFNTVEVWATCFIHQAFPDEAFIF